MLFTYLSLAALSLLLRGLFFSCHKQGLLSSCSVRAPYCRGSSCCGARAPGCTCFNDCGTWAPQLQLPGSRARAQQLWHTDLVGPWLVGSSQIRGWTHVPCIGRWILYHWATREAPENLIYFYDDAIRPNLSPLSTYLNVTKSKLTLLIMHEANKSTD